MLLDRFARRSSRLQVVTAALAQTTTVSGIGEVLAAHGCALADADATLLFLLDGSARELELVAFGASDRTRIDPYRRVPLDGELALARAVRAGAPVWLASRDEVAAFTPELASVAHDGDRLQGLAAIPLRGASGVIGGLALAFHRPPDLDDVGRDLLLALSFQCATSIERARALESERDARERLAREEDRLRLLAHASEMLSSSLDSRAALSQLARLIVPAVADWCAIDELGEDGAICRVAVADVDPAKITLAHRLSQLQPLPDDPHGVARVLRTGTSEYVPEISDERLAASARGPEYLATIRALGLGSYAVVPLRARGRALGAITLVTEGARRISPHDLRFAEELAGRAAVALENARLFEAAESARQQLHELFASAPAAIAVVRGREHRYELANAPARRIAGGRELVGRTVREVFPELEGQAVIALLNQVLEHGEAISRTELPVALLGPDGRLEDHYFDLVYQPVREGRGAVAGVAAFAFDVTHQVRARREIEALAADVARSEARMRALVEATAVIVWNATATGEVIEPSPTWLTFTGQTEAEYRNGGFLEAIHPDDRERTMTIWTTAVGAAAPYAAEYRLRRCDGSYAHTLARGRPVRAPDGTVVEYIGCNVDVTELRRAEAAAQEHAATLKTINDLGRVIAAELDGQVVVQAVTDAVTKLTGAQFGAFFYNVQDERGARYMLYTLSGVPRDQFEKFPMPGKTAVFEPTFSGRGVVRSDDITRDPRYGRNPPHHGMPPGHLPVRSYLAVPVVSRAGAVLSGIFLGHAEAGVFGERAETLAEGLAAQASVAMENARLFGDAQRLIQALEAKNRELDQFAYVTSHDLRAPLRGIGSLAEWIEEDLGPGLDPETKRKLDLLRGRVRRMEALIQGILDYSRAARIDGKREDVDVGRLLEDVVELLAPPSGALVRAASKLPVIHTERSALSQVLMNLVGNGLKHAGRPDVVIDVEARDAGRTWELRVSDNGSGVPEEFRERVWGIFQTLQPRDQLESTGIGLAIVRKIVESRAGRAWIESAPSGGACFVFTWPKRDERGDER